MFGFFLSPFGPEIFAPKDRAGRLFSRQPAHSPQPFSVIIIIQLEINKLNVVVPGHTRGATISPITKATNNAMPRKLALSRSDSARSILIQQLGDKVIWFIFTLPDWVPNKYKPAARGELIRKK